MAVIELLGLAVFLYLCYWFLKPKPKAKLPDGPPGIPIFGNALQFSQRQGILDMSNVGKNFDDAYTLNLFGEKVVILNSYDMIKEALVSPKYATIFSGRPTDFASQYLFPNGEVFATYSEEWSAFRKLVFRGLKTYGSNLEEVEDLVKGETKYLIERLENENGKAVDPFVHIGGYVTSVISMLITGRHLQQEDEQLKLLAKIVQDLTRIFDPANQQLLTMLPWLRFLPVGPGALYQEIMGDISKMKKNIDRDRKKLWAEGERKPCFLDFMYEEKEKGNVSEENITGVMLDMLAAGSVTTRSTLYSMFLVLTAKPDIQKRIQEEIDEVVGRGRLPCASDKHSMPYSQAFLWEVLRYYTTDPITLPRSTMESVHIRDYLFPKGLSVFYNIWRVHHDEKFWKEPHVFNPSRFLDNTGNLVPPEDERRQRILAFGIGKRACIGETLARLRVFLALVSVLQNFNLVPDPSHPLPDTDSRTFIAEGLLLAPPYKIVFKPRSL